MFARITWYKRVRKSVHLRSTIDSLMIEIRQLKKQIPKKKKTKGKKKCVDTPGFV
jgi:hypothetical protein